MSVLKQILGVDVSQKELVVSLGRMNDDLSVELYSYRVFRNNETGFEALHKWLKKNTVTNVHCRILMEATGVYHQKFAHFVLEKDMILVLYFPIKLVTTCVPWIRKLLQTKHAVKQ